MRITFLRARYAHMRAWGRRVGAGCELRPHVKTTKTVEGALLQTGGSKRRITVSTLAEAGFFADAGFDDILYAVPLTVDKLPEAASLSRRLGAFHLIVDNRSTVDALLSQPPPSAHKQWSVFLMVDCGYHRDGVDPEDEGSVTLAKRLEDAATCTFAGVYTHGGHSYDASSTSEVRRIAGVERDSVTRFAARLRGAGVPCPVVGVGSTPTCSLPPPHLDGVDEMHPGNYIYNDVTQATLGACAAADIAVRVLTRVVGHYPKQNMLLVDMGWTGCSAQGAESGYGALLEARDLKVKLLKQEAGEVVSADGAPIDFGKYPIGTILQLAPWHSCAATQQHQVIHALDGDHRTIVDTWQICKGWAQPQFISHI